jgi:hypothetical protein
MDWLPGLGKVRFLKANKRDTIERQKSNNFLTVRIRGRNSNGFGMYLAVRGRHYLVESDHFLELLTT